MAKNPGDLGEGGGLHYTIMPYHRWPMQLSMADQHRLVCEFRSKAAAHAVPVTGTNSLSKLWKCIRRILAIARSSGTETSVLEDIDAS